MIRSAMLLLEEENSSGVTLNSLFLVVVGTMLLVFLLRAALGYRKYKESLFPHIYENYLIDYYYRLNVLQDASKSSGLSKAIGTHRLVYSNLTDKSGRLVCQILTVLHSKGVLALAYLSTTGKISGKQTGDWMVKRKDGDQIKTYRIANPAVYLKEYNAHLSQVLDGKEVQYAVALKDECDISDIHISYPVVHYSEVSDLIKNADCGYGLNDTEIEELFVKLGGKK